MVSIEPFHVLVAFLYVWSVLLRDSGHGEDHASHGWK
jgi:hypothetical protein